MAANISKELGIQGITFNPAGVNPMTTIGNRLDGFFTNPIGSFTNVWNGIGQTSWNHIDSYVTSTDWLTTLQTAAFPVVGTDGRTSVEHIPTVSANTIIPAHGLGNFINHYYDNQFKTYADIGKGKDNDAR